MSTQAAGVRFGLLGPVTATREGVVLDLGPRQRRVLLIRLLVARGRAVSLGQLSDDLWEERVPTRAATSVHAHISRLRRVLHPAEPSAAVQDGVLATTPYGYVLHVADEDRDTVRFERAVAAGRQLLDAGRPERAAEVLTAALSHWRGDALEDAATLPFAAREITRLTECRHDAQELRARALLMAGRPDQAVLAAHALIDEEPLRESAWDLLLRSLWLLGRSAEAAQQYDRARRILHEELGVGPGPALRGLRRAMQRHDLSVLGTDSHRRTRVAC
ncbi:BTAD domain-containing putative transcriptional regulator [Streptomyces sp. NPDC096105]|uniref:AfsR/SARP family transcriptional regulator n=1 Tax=Streptomyces sp. NPDC096105 TaxID=3366074 RepID=UPI00382820DA